jgi:hypothetical protein
LTGGAGIARHGLEVLKEHRRPVGRDYDEIIKAKLGHPVISRHGQEASP